MSVLARRVSGGKPFSGRVKVKGNFCVRGCFVNLRVTNSDSEADITMDEKTGRLSFLIKEKV